MSSKRRKSTSVLPDWNCHSSNWLGNSDWVSRTALMRKQGTSTAQRLSIASIRIQSVILMSAYRVNRNERLATSSVNDVFQSSSQLFTFSYIVRRERISKCIAIALSACCDRDECNLIDRYSFVMWNCEKRWRVNIVCSFRRPSCS